MKKYIVAGTWAKKYNTSSGGKLLVFQQREGTSELMQTIETGKSISALAYDKDNCLLFATCETNYHDENSPGGEIQVYQIENGHSLRLLGKYNSYGGFPVGIVLTEKHIVVLNHGSSLAKVCLTYRNEGGKIVTDFTSDEASLCLFKKAEDGSVGEFVDYYVFRGHGQLPVFQESPAPHDLYFMQEQEVLCVPERGTDETRLFRIDKEKDRIIPIQILKNREQTGPRNVVCMRGSAPGGAVKYVYVLAEIEPVITVFRMDDKECEKIQEISTIKNVPENIPCTSFDYPHPSGIVINNEKRKLYSITRKVNLLSVFDILPDGSLESEQELDLGGENPRQIVLCRNHLYVICMDSQNILKIELDAEGRPGQIYPVVHQVEDIACAKFIQEGETNG